MFPCVYAKLHNLQLIVWAFCLRVNSLLKISIHFLGWLLTCSVHSPFLLVKWTCGTKWHWEAFSSQFAKLWHLLISLLKKRPETLCLVCDLIGLYQWDQWEHLNIPVFHLFRKLLLCMLAAVTTLNKVGQAQQFFFPALGLLNRGITLLWGRKKYIIS